MRGLGFLSPLRYKKPCKAKSLALHHLVLESEPLKLQTPTTDRDRAMALARPTTVSRVRSSSSRASAASSSSAAFGTEPSSWGTPLQPQDEKKANDLAFDSVAVNKADIEVPNHPVDVSSWECGLGRFLNRSAEKRPPEVSLALPTPRSTFYPLREESPVDFR